MYNTLVPIIFLVAAIVALIMVVIFAMVVMTRQNKVIETQQGLIRKLLTRLNKYQIEELMDELDEVFDDNA